MVPRTEMVCVAEQTLLRDAIALSCATSHPRLPIHSGTVDAIWGVLNVKLLPLWRRRVRFDQTLREIAESLHAAPEPAPRPLIKEAFIVPELCHVDALLVELRARGDHTAILIDEFGGTAGMVTIDTLLDALVGGLIEDAPQQRLIDVRPNGDIIAAGRVRLAQLNWECGCHLPEEQNDTLAGYVMRLAGALPPPGRVVHDADYEFHVLGVAGTRLDVVRVRKLRAGGAAP